MTTSPAQFFSPAPTSSGGNFGEVAQQTVAVLQYVDQLIQNRAATTLMPPLAPAHSTPLPGSEHTSHSDDRILRRGEYTMRDIQSQGTANSHLFHQASPSYTPARRMSSTSSQCEATRVKDEAVMVQVSLREAGTQSNDEYMGEFHQRREMEKTAAKELQISGSAASSVAKGTQTERHAVASIQTEPERRVSTGVGTERTGDDLHPVSEAIYTLFESQARHIEQRSQAALAPIREKIIRLFSTTSTLYSFESSRRKWIRRLEQSEAAFQTKLHDTEHELAMCRNENEQLREELAGAKKTTVLLEGSLAALRQQLHDSDVRQQTLDAMLSRFEGNVAAAAAAAASAPVISNSAPPSPSLGTPMLSPAPHSSRSGEDLVVASQHCDFPATNSRMSRKPPRPTVAPVIVKSTVLALYYECQSLLEEDSELDEA